MLTSTDPVISLLNIDPKGVILNKEKSFVHKGNVVYNRKKNLLHITPLRFSHAFSYSITTCSQLRLREIESLALQTQTAVSRAHCSNLHAYCLKQPKESILFTHILDYYATI